MKRKTMTLVLCLLAALALVSVGFASWVISVDANEVIAGNIKVDTVTDSRISATVTLDNNEIIFGTPKEEANIGWLTNTAIGKEVLTTKLTIVATKGGAAYTRAENKIEITLKSGSLSEDKKSITESKNFTNVAKAGYVKELQTSFVVTETEVAGTYEVTITFAWGSHFGDDNPYTYYNAQDPDAKISEVEDAKTYAQDAYDSLYEMNRMLENCGFLITVKVKN